MPVTLKDIAGEVGMSQMTVSRALRGIGSIDVQTRDRIRRVAKKLGYTSDRIVVASPGRSKGYPLRLLAPSIDNPISDEPGVWYLDRMVEGLSRRLRRAYGQLLLAHFDSIDKLIASYREHNCHGFVLRQALPPHWLEKLERTGPVVYALPYDFHGGVDCVYSNEHRGAVEIYNRLLRYGHQHIAWLGVLDHHRQNRIADHPDSVPNVEHWLVNPGHGPRHAAWANLTRCQLHGREQPLILIPRDWRCDSLEVTVKRGLDQILTAAPMPTAVVGASDPVTIELICQLRRLGLQIPRDMSVVSYGGSPEGKAHRPALSGMEMPMEMIGRVIPELIERRLADPEAAPLSVQLEMGWCEGETLAPPPEHKRSISFIESRREASLT